MQSIQNLIHKIDQVIIDPLIVLMFGCALLYFIWGIFQYVVHGDEATEREKGRNHMIYGVFGMFIMIGVFGIVHIIINTIGASSAGVNQVIKGN